MSTADTSRAPSIGRREPVHVVGIGGAMRAGSSSELALGHVLATSERLGATTQMFAGPSLAFPMYDPQVTTRGDVASALIAALRRADGIVVATPSYHGGMSGLIKNALDYVEDLSGDARPYLDGRAVGIVVLAAGMQAFGSTLTNVRATAHTLRAWPTPFAATVVASAGTFSDGRVVDAGVAEQLDLVAQQVVSFAQMRRGAD